VRPTSLGDVITRPASPRKQCGLWRGCLRRAMVRNVTVRVMRLPASLNPESQGDRIFIMVPNDRRDGWWARLKC